VLIESFADQRDADQQQEAEGQHLHGRMTVDEIADRAGRKEHHHDGDHHGEHHHRQMLSHADSGNHRIEREHDIEQQDLDDDADE
jgi:hypothetical protein